MSNMKISGIVAEFNPFHNGHAYLISRAKSAGASYVVAVMSGNFVQRGQAAIADKFTRAKAALAGGADLVLDLPVAYSVSTAARFALGAITILKASGIVDTIAFGSESGDSSALRDLAAAVEGDIAGEMIGKFLSQGMTFARARQLAVAEQSGEKLACMLAYPNNALAVEYLRSAGQLNWEPEIFTTHRLGVAHDAASPQGEMASASYLRGIAKEGGLLSAYMPKECLEVFLEACAEGRFPADPKRLEIAMLADLRRKTRHDLAILPDISEGIENRMYKAIRAASSLEELYSLAKTKRYTLARIRRLALAAFLGVTEKDQTAPPAYIRVIGCAPHAKHLMDIMGKRADLPLGTSLAALGKQSAACARQAYLEEICGDSYTLALPKPLPCGHELRERLPIMGK